MDGKIKKVDIELNRYKEQKRSKWLSRMLKLLCNIEDKVDEDSGEMNVVGFFFFIMNEIWGLFLFLFFVW